MDDVQLGCEIEALKELLRLRRQVKDLKRLTKSDTNLTRCGNMLFELDAAVMEAGRLVAKLTSLEA